MLSYAITAATNYFHLPIDDQEDADIAAWERKYLTWVTPTDSTNIVQQILQNNNLYDILGVSRSASLDRMSLRRAYLARSRVCHPDKFPHDPDATYAFQKVAVAYDVLSKPSTRRVYDSRSSSSSYDAFAAHPVRNAEETFRGVIIGVFNDFLDGDLEVIRTLLRAINDINPSMKLGDDGIDSVLSTLEAIRERALTCRTCIYVLHAELTRLLEVQHAFRSLSYFDIIGRSRLAIKLTRITLSLPIALERALHEDYRDRARDRGGVGGDDDYDDDHRNSSTNNNNNNRPPERLEQQAIIFPRHVTLLIRGLDVMLDKMERILK